MTQHLGTRAAISWSSTSDVIVEHLHHLAVPLRQVRPAYSRSVFVAESLDRSVFETVTVGNGAYELVGRVTLDNNPHQLLELLKAGDAGRTLTYYPDLRDPNVNYACRLISPRGGDLATELDAQRATFGDGSIELRLRPATSPSASSFHPLDVQSNVLFWLRAGDAITGATFSRGSVGRYAAIGSGGTDTSAAANRLRLHYVDSNADRVRDTPSLLLESSRTNLITTNAIAGGSWSDLGTPVTTGGQADPAGGTSGVLVEDDSAGANEARIIAVTFTGNGTKAVSAFVRQGTATLSTLRLEDTTAGTVRGALQITWTNGIPVLAGSIGTEVVFGPERYRGGWWRVGMAVAGVVAANTNVFELFGADGQSVAPTGSTYWYGPQAENAVTMSSYILTTGSTQTRSADSLTYTYAARPQAMTVYVKLLELGTVREATDAFVLELGTNSQPRLLVYNNGTGVYNVLLNRGSGTDSQSAASVSPVYGDVVELSGTMTETGRVQISQSINGSAITQGSLGAQPSFGLPADWSTTTLRLAGGSVGFHGLLNVAIVRGVHTLEAMRRVARVA